MSGQDIQRKSIDGELFGRPVPDREFGAVHNPGKPDFTPKRNFLTRAKEFALGKSKSGEAFHTALIAAAGIFAGINIEPLLSTLHGGTQQMDLHIIELLLMAIVGVIGFFTSRELVKGLLQDILEEVRDIAKAVQAARAADSPGGEKITEQEKQLILKEVDDLVMVLYKRLLRSRLARIFGLKTHQKEP